ncbi:MAG: hypothetical protein Q9207_001993 [Kuettlingeria erythrocarpa]
MPSTVDVAALPNGSSPTLQLVQANYDEMIESSRMNAVSWRGPLDVEAYLEREACLRGTDLGRNGGITYWILVDRAASSSEKGVRTILASCETIKKRALVARPDRGVKEVVSHGIGSVFCPVAHRGKGYAQRMLAELGTILDTWQQKEGEKGEFTALWSDIGKKFYARLGWTVYASSHITLPAKSASDHSHPLLSVTKLASEDLEELCKVDEASLRSTMARSTWSDVEVRVSLIPDAATMQWHHAREDFLSLRLCSRLPSARGALATTRNGRRAWCVWTRTFGPTRQESVLNILRLVVEAREEETPMDNAVSEQSVATSDDENRDDENRDAMKHAISAVLEQAQLEASDWGMASVVFWNPSPLTISAAKELDPSVVLTDRDDESITSLRWHGQPLPASAKIDWIANEKYGWC